MLAILSFSASNPLIIVKGLSNIHGKEETMDRDAIRIRRMKNGDEAALETFVREHYPAILRYCHLHIPDAGYAEDAAQEVFVRFFRTLQAYQHYGKAQNYLYVIAANLCRDFYRKPREIPIDELPEEPILEMEPLELRLDVREAIRQLPPELREIAILSFFQELKQKEIAQILGISIPLVKYRIRRAKELLAASLGKEKSP